MDAKIETSKAYREAKAVLEMLRSASKTCPGLAETIVALIDTGILDDAVKYEKCREA